MDASGLKGQNPTGNKDHVRVQRRTLEALLQQCQMALQQLTSDCDDGLVDAEDSADSSSPSCCDDEAAQFSDLLKSRIECDDFLEKLENARALLPHTAAEEASSWDVVGENDLWEGGDDIEKEDYVLVRQEDIVEGIACFMAGYLLSLKETKDITPNQLQEALSKTFSNKRKKGKLRKAWDGSRVVYNVASWGATAVGIYQNPAILRAASAAFWTSCHVISKLL